MSNRSRRPWTFMDLAIWKIIPDRLGGGKGYIRGFKDGWVRYNRWNIRCSAVAYKISPQLLGGTAWIEVGGDPQIVDTLAYAVRSFDWSGPDWVDKHLTMTKNPNKTSFGAVSIQLRTAADAMRLNLDEMSAADKRTLIRCLETDACNLDVVAKHLHDLILHDFPDANTNDLTQDQIRVVGARYNRGAGLSLDSIRKNTSYGDFILKIWTRVGRLLDCSRSTGGGAGGGGGGGW